jgi:hypothetical protein
MPRKGGDKPLPYNDYENVGAGITPAQKSTGLSEDELRAES